MKVCDTEQVREIEFENEALGQSANLVCISENFHVRPAYPKIHFRIMNPLSQLYINRKFQKYVSVSICHCYRASFMRSLFIEFMNGDILSYVLALQLKLLCGVLNSGLLYSLQQLAWLSLGKTNLHLPLRITFCRISP